MKRLLLVVMAMVLCLGSFALAEEAEVPSPMMPYIIAASSISGYAVDANGQRIADDAALVISTNTENYAYNAAAAHVVELRSARPKRNILGADIVAKLALYKFFACVPAQIRAYSGENDLCVELYSEYAFAIQPDDVVMLVLCIPTEDGGYQYELLEGKGLGENRVECLIPAAVAQKLPTDKPVLFDFFAK